MAEPSLDFWNRILPPQGRQADTVGLSFLMVAVLPGDIEVAPSATAKIACLESWFVHMRLLIEYLGLHSSARSSQDFSALDVVWSVPSDPELQSLWTTASQHVVHFSQMRTPQLIEEISPFDISRENLERLATRILEIAENYIHALEQGAYSTAPTLRLALLQAQEKLKR